MTDIKIMVVDDSNVIRKLLIDTLTSETGLEVAGFAVDGNDCLTKIEQLKPDVLILDVEMPNRDGLQTLQELKARGSKTPVIMFSTLTARGSKATIDALTFGASDYVAKPSNTGDFMTSIKRVREELVPKIRALHDSNQKRATMAPGQPAPAAPAATPGARQPSFRASGSMSAIGGLDAVVIGVSTGGPNALAEYIPKLPASFPVPVFIVQHMPATFTPLLADRLNQKSPLTVVEAQDGMIPEAGFVYIAPGDYHMAIENDREGKVIRLNQGMPENSCRPAADVLFRTATQAYGRKILGVVMTGMGHDGTAGADAVKKAGGLMIVQDQASSVVWSMAGSVAKNGLADEQVPLHLLADRTVENVTKNRLPTAGRR